MPRVLLVVNPQASGVTDAAAETVAAALGPGVEVVRTERRGNAVELVRDADAGAVVVFGGDGAFNEALNGLRAGLPLGLVPGGGSTLLYAGRVLEKVKVDNADQQAGVNIVKRALQSPLPRRCGWTFCCARCRRFCCASRFRWRSWRTPAPRWRRFARLT